MAIQRFIDLINKEISGSISEEEREDLKRFRNESTENEKVYTETLDVWKKSGGFKLSATSDTQASWDSFQEKLAEHSKPKVFVFSPMYRVAAAILIAATLSLVLFNPWGAEEFITEVGETLEITLPDESVITLNESSELVLSREFNESERKVTFTGEAYFSVAENPDKPFIIQSGISEIRVLGTSFNVDAKDGNAIEVDVTSGRVSLSEIDNPANQAILTRGMKGALTSETMEVISTTSVNRNFLAWQTRQLEFDDLGMNQVIADIEEYFGEEISVSNQAILNCNFTSSFSDPNLDEVLEILSLTLYLDYQQTSGEHILSGEGCAEIQD